MGRKTTSPALTQCHSSVPVPIEYLDYAYYCINILPFLFPLDGVQKTKSVDDQQHQNKKLCLGHY